MGRAGASRNCSRCKPFSPGSGKRHTRRWREAGASACEQRARACPRRGQGQVRNMGPGLSVLLPAALCGHAGQYIFTTSRSDEHMAWCAAIHLWKAKPRKLRANSYSLLLVQCMPMGAGECTCGGTVRGNVSVEFGRSPARGYEGLGGGDLHHCIVTSRLCQPTFGPNIAAAANQCHARCWAEGQARHGNASSRLVLEDDDSLHAHERRLGGGDLHRKSG